MEPAKHSEIRTVEFDAGDIAFSTEFLTKPFGSSIFAAEDVSADSKKILEDLISWWDLLWPNMLDKLQNGIEGYETGQKLGVDEFVGSVSGVDPECYMGDKSDIHLRLEFEEPPLWDYFLRNGKIAHFQPVF